MDDGVLNTLLFVVLVGVPLCIIVIRLNRKHGVQCPRCGERGQVSWAFLGLFKRCYACGHSWTW